MVLDGNYPALLCSFGQWGEKEARCYDYFSDFVSDACYGDSIHGTFFLCKFALEEGSGEVLSYDDVLREMALWEDGRSTPDGSAVPYTSREFSTTGYKRFDVRTMRDEVYEHCFNVNWISMHMNELKLLFPNIDIHEATKTVHGVQRRRLFSKRFDPGFGFEWFVKQGVDFGIPKDISIERMQEIYWAMSDERNTINCLYRAENGLNFKKHGDERSGEHYRELFFRFRQEGDLDERTTVLVKAASTHLLLEQKGGSLLTTDEFVDFQARFIFFAGATMEEPSTDESSTDESEDLIPRIPSIFAQWRRPYDSLVFARVQWYKDRKVHRRLLWLLLHRRGLHEQHISKAIMRLAELI